MSAIGTFRTCRRTEMMSAYSPKAEVREPLPVQSVDSRLEGDADADHSPPTQASIFPEDTNSPTDQSGRTTIEIPPRRLPEPAPIAKVKCPHDWHRLGRPRIEARSWRQ